MKNRKQRNKEKLAQRGINPIISFDDEIINCFITMNSTGVKTQAQLVEEWLIKEFGNENITSLTHSEGHIIVSVNQQDIIKFQIIVNVDTKAVFETDGSSIVTSNSISNVISRKLQEAFK